MKCLKCETKNGEYAKYCKQCGAVLNESVVDIGCNKNSKLLITYALVVVGVLLIGVKVFGQKSCEKFMEYVEKNNHEAAYELFVEKIQKSDKQMEELEKLVKKELNDYVKSYYSGEITFSEADFYIAQYGDYFWGEVIAAKREINELHESQNNYQVAQGFYEKENYLEARKYYELVIQEDANYESAKQKIKECYNKYVENLKQRIETLVAKEDYKQVIQICDSEEANLVDVDVEWINGLRLEMEQKHVEQIINTVNTCLEKRQIEKAGQYVNEALRNYPQNVILLELQNTVYEYYPIYLEDKFLVEANNIKDRSSYYHDTSGNYYKDAEYYWTSSVYSKADEVVYDTYNLNGEYMHFSATLAPRAGWKDVSSDEGTNFYIVADGNVIFWAYIDKRTSPIPIELDITNVRELKVGIGGGNLVYILMAEPHIYKRY